MAVEVKIPTVFRKSTGGEAVVRLEPDTIGGLLAQIEAAHPGFKDQVMTQGGELHRYVNIYVNDEDARYLDKLDTRVSHGDVVSLLPSVAGG